MASGGDGPPPALERDALFKKLRSKPENKVRVRGWRRRRRSSVMLGTRPAAGGGRCRRRASSQRAIAAPRGRGAAGPRPLPGAHLTVPDGSLTMLQLLHHRFTLRTN